MVAAWRARRSTLIFLAFGRFEVSFRSVAASPAPRSGLNIRTGSQIVRGTILRLLASYLIQEEVMVGRCPGHSRKKLTRTFCTRTTRKDCMSTRLHSSPLAAYFTMLLAL